MELRKQFGQTQLLRSAEAEWAPSSETISDKELLGQKIKEILAKAGITSTSISFALGGKEAIVRYFEMPLLPKSERQNAIRFEAQKYISFDIRELYCNFDVIIDKDARKMRVFFLASKKETVDRHMAFFHQLGLQITALEPAALSLMRIVFHVSPPRDAQPSLIIDADSDGTVNIVITKNNMILLSRDCNISKFSDGPMKLDFASLASEIRLTLNYFGRTFKNEKIQRLILCVEPENEFQDWPARLGAEFGLAAQVGNPPGLFGQAGTLSPGVLLAAGLAMREIGEGSVSRLNLIPQESSRLLEQTAPLRPAEESKLMRQWAIGGAIGMAALILVAHLALSLYISSERAGAVLDGPPLQELQRQEITLKQKQAFFNSLINRKAHFTLKMNELARIVPKNIELSSLVYRSEETSSAVQNASLRLEWQVSAPDAGTAFLEANRFISDLKASGDFMSGFSELKMNPSAGQGFEGVFSFSASSQGAAA